MSFRQIFHKVMLASFFTLMIVPMIWGAQDNTQTNKVMGKIEFEGKTKAEKTAGVWADGQYVGYANELRDDKELLLLPGKHLLSMRQTGYLNDDQDITVNPGATTLVQVELTSDPNAQFSNVNAQVKLVVTPDRAAVLVDGKFAGTAHDFGGVGRAMLVAPGHHHLMIDLVGYQPFRTDIDLTANQKVTIKADLVPGSPDDAAPAIKKQ